MTQQNEALTDFWWHVSQDTRIEVRLQWLHKLAEVRVTPFQSWNYVKERTRWAKTRGARIARIKRNRCFLCQKRAELEHHIIQAQNGGTNAKRNRVFLCKPCHRDVHPWMKEMPDGPWPKKANSSIEGSSRSGPRIRRKSPKLKRVKLGANFDPTPRLRKLSLPPSSGSVTNRVG